MFVSASYSRTSPMICSSVNRFVFIVRLYRLGRTSNLSGGTLQWQVTTEIEAVFPLSGACYSMSTDQHCRTF